MRLSPIEGKRTRMLVVLPLITVVIFVSASVASAHAKLLRTQPENKATLNQAPQKVELWFNEDLQAQFNTITVTDQKGQRVDKSNASLAEGNQKLETDLQDLPSGTYTVAWKILSADQHTMKGQFTFTVTVAPASNSAAQRTTPQSTPSPETLPGESTQESGATFSLTASRWLQFLSSMALFGGFLFQLLIFGPSLTKIRGLGETERLSTLRLRTSRFRSLSWWSVALLAFGLIASLVAQTAAVLDIGLAKALAPLNLYQALTSTSFGTPWLVELAMLVIVAASLSVLPKAAGLWPLWIGVIAMSVMFFALSITGHAGAAAKEWHSALVSDWLHLITAGIWVGGLFHLALTLPRVASALNLPQRMNLLAELIPRFTWYAIPSTVLLALTGVYNSWIHLDSFAALWSTAYGKTVLLKIAIFIPMLILGGINTFVIHPRAKRLIEGSNTPSDTNRLNLDRKFLRSVAFEAVLGVAVLFAAAVLVFLQPAREHPGMAESGKSRSMLIAASR